MKFKKCIIGILLAVTLLSSFPTITASAAGRELKKGIAFVSASSLRLRSAPSTSASSKILDYAYDNEVVIILGKTGNWYKVLYNLKEGYMYGDYLNVTTVENVELGYGKVNYAGVNMRTGPGTGYKSIGKSYTGDLAYIIGINQQWFKVIWNDSICYIRSDYLDLTEYPYENRGWPKSPLFFRGGNSTGVPVSVSAFKNSPNYIGSNGSSSAAAEGNQIVATAKKYIGVPYLWAGNSPDGFDCSGFTQYVFGKHGISLNRTTTDQYRQGSFVPKSDLRAGDLVFFQNTYKAGISHVGIYIGNGQFIHVSSSRGVVISSLSESYYVTRYYGARRVI